MLIVVSIMGLLILIMVPRVEKALAFRSVSAVRSGYASLFTRAKIAAAATRQVATVTVNSTSAFGSLTTPTGVQFMSSPVEFGLGVTVTASAASIKIEPSGLVSTTNTPYSVIISRGGVVDTVRITGYGRVE